MVNFIVRLPSIGEKGPFQVESLDCAILYAMFFSMISGTFFDQAASRQNIPERPWETVMLGVLVANVTGAK